LGQSGGSPLSCGIQWFNSGGSLIEDDSDTPAAISTSPTLIAKTVTAPTGAVTAIPYIRYTSPGANEGFGADGVQFEDSPVATPYVETNGSTESRGASAVTAPASALNPTQGWVAMRVRVPYSSSNIPYGRAQLFEWWDSGTSNAVEASLTQSGSQGIVSVYRNGGSYVDATWSAGDTLTIIIGWTATQVEVSVNGSSFQTFSNTTIPTITNTTFSIASGTGVGGAARYLDGDVLWAATGSGGLTNTDATTINSLGNSDPSPSTLPGTPTLAWSANTTSYSYANATTDTTTYTYDSLGRLETVTNPDASSKRYCYDADSNRTYLMSSSTDSCGSSGATSTYTYATGTDNPVDALTSQTGPTRSFSYDGSGTALGDGMITARGSDSLSYDGSGRLKAATVGGTTVCYTFDPLGNLMTRTYKTSSSTCSSPTGTTNYLLGDLYETNASNTTTTSYIDGPAGDLTSYNGPPTTSSTATYLYYDGHGNLAAEADSSGNITSGGEHTYDPFGAPLDTPPANATSHRYVGADNKQYDSTSGLILMGARPYDPTLGRFLTVDPIDGGSLNNYDYADQDPINNYDLAGTSVIPKAVKKLVKKTVSVAKKVGEDTLQAAQEVPYGAYYASYETLGATSTGSSVGNFALDLLTPRGALVETEAGGLGGDWAIDAAREKSIYDDGRTDSVLPNFIASRWDPSWLRIYLPGGGTRQDGSHFVNFHT
jgi:RHS repeat-associated protein